MPPGTNLIAMNSTPTKSTAPRPLASPTYWSSARVPAWKSGLLLVLGLATVMTCWLSRPADTTPVAGVLMDLPDSVPGWGGKETKISETELSILPGDTEFARMTYRNRIGDEILCSIVLAGSQDRSIHRPERCLPGQGYSISQSTPLDLTMPGGQTLTVQCLELSRPHTLANGTTIPIRSLYLYWFVGDHFTTNSNLVRTARSIFDRVFLNRQHRWAYVIISSPITDSYMKWGRNREETRKILLAFMQSIVPRFQKDFIASGGDPAEVGEQ